MQLSRPNRSTALWARIALGLLTFVPVVAIDAATFALPAACTQGATGSDYGHDPLFGGLWPQVTVSYVSGSRNIYVDTVSLVADGHGGWTYAFVPPAASQSYLVVATYTPFLQSYTAVWPTSSGLFTAALPPAGTINHAAASLMPTATITLTTAIGNGVPMPGGFLEMAPDFPGSSPYTLQADQNGVVTIDCFTSLAAGNYGTVSSPDGYYAYDAVFTFSGTDSQGRAVLAAH